MLFCLLLSRIGAEVRFKITFLSNLSAISIGLLWFLTLFVGFWLKSYSFFEQPTVHFTYEYLLIAETEDPSQPIVCAEGAIFDDDMVSDEENCAEIQVCELA